MTPAFSASWPNLFQTITDIVHLLPRLERAVAEERQQDHRARQFARERDRFGDPPLAELVILEIILVQDIETGRGDGELALPGFGQELFLQRRIVQRQSVWRASQTNLHAVKTDALGEFDRTGFASWLRFQSVTPIFNFW
jgi:hypothetical protein